MNQEPAIPPILKAIIYWQQNNPFLETTYCYVTETDLAYDMGVLRKNGWPSVSEIVLGVMYQLTVMKKV